MIIIIVRSVGEMVVFFLLRHANGRWDDDVGEFRETGDDTVEL